MNYEFHPLADVLPLMDDGELDNLADDIQKNGQILPIYLFEGKILDGRNRYMACTRAGIEPYVAACEDDDVFRDAATFVESLNLHRRQLSPPKRAAAIVQLRKAGMSYRQIGAAVGVSHETVRQLSNELTVEQPDKIKGKDGKSRPSTRKHTVRDSHSETTEEPISADDIPHNEFTESLDESTGELTPAETSQAIVESFAADMARWSERLNAVELEQHQVERCCEAVAKFIRTVKP